MTSRGLSPRGRGNHTIPMCHRFEGGLSPRGRGNRNSRFRPRLRLRWVYPRVGGGNLPAHRGLRVLVFCDGLSPRGRGNHDQNKPGLPQLERSIPAWAGEPSGGKVVNRSIPAWAGDPQSTCLAGGWTRSIPAWAGEPHLGVARVLVVILEGLSPRGRGNRQSLTNVLPSDLKGLSPRGRGNLRLVVGTAVCGEI